jgi:hypothetical protein
MVAEGSPRANRRLVPEHALGADGMGAWGEATKTLRGFREDVRQAALRISPRGVGPRGEIPVVFLGADLPVLDGGTNLANVLRNQ